LTYLDAHRDQGLRYVFAPEPSLTKTKVGSYKGQLLAYILSIAKGELAFFIDADTEIRLEDARKLIRMASRFDENPKLGIIQFKQYIFNWPYLLSTRVIRYAIGSFWSTVLHAKMLFGFVGFMGTAACSGQST